ncbi:MAG: cupin domain-containing protein [Chloroflexi bacterium]|nr:cupin domain-containing protein [Chloroflexota bacterium]
MAKQSQSGAVVDLAGLARATAEQGAVWAYGGADLNVNLVVFEVGRGVSEHLNAEVDVLLVGLLGAGTVTVDGETHELRVGQALVVPKGRRRAIVAGADRFAYLTCHRRRGGLQPATRATSSPELGAGLESSQGEGTERSV